MTELPAPVPVKPTGLIGTLRTVAFGLLGVAANREDLDQGKAHISPLRILLIALVFMAIFVGGLVTLATRIAKG